MWQKRWKKKQISQNKTRKWLWLWNRTCFLILNNQKCNWFYLFYRKISTFVFHANAFSFFVKFYILKSVVNFKFKNERTTAHTHTPTHSLIHDRQTSKLNKREKPSPLVLAAKTKEKIFLVPYYINMWQVLRHTYYVKENSIAPKTVTSIEMDNIAFCRDKN